MIRVLLVLVVFATCAQAERVRIGTSPDFPPYVFLKKTGAIAGFDYAVISRICRRAKLDCVWVSIPFDGLFRAVSQGTIDVAAGGISITKARARLVTFSEPHLGASSRGWMLGLPNQKKPASKANFAVQSGSIHQDQLQKNGWRSKPYKTNQQAIQATISGKVDYLFASETFLRQVLKSGATPLVFVAEHPVISPGQAFAFPKKGRSFKAIFDRELQIMKQDGSLARLRSKWLKAN